MSNDTGQLTAALNNHRTTNSTSLKTTQVLTERPYHFITYTFESYQLVPILQASAPLSAGSYIFPLTCILNLSTHSLGIRGSPLLHCIHVGIYLHRYSSRFLNSFIPHRSSKLKQNVSCVPKVPSALIRHYRYVLRE